ncbi:DUF6456 domain-containing protein [Cognatishimia sp. SS12]|nr:DUF6456 domain-containing protein [Cognatishimia sp. SS12]
MRQIRRVEARREDPLIDEALVLLGKHVQADDGHSAASLAQVGRNALPEGPPSEESFDNAAREVLSKLNQPSAVLAVAVDMEKGVVVRDGADGVPERMAVVDRAIAQALALKDWISCQTAARISRYEITPAGRDALAQLLAAGANVALRDAADAAAATSVRFHSQESPLTVLARHRDREGKPFISRDLVAAGERLREDFELAQMNGVFAADICGWLAETRASRDTSADHTAGHQVQNAADRLHRAFETLGEGLADVALRCCCYQEGLEQAERSLGWPARSGKVVLRIALARLAAHYQAARQEQGDLIG